MTEYKGMTGEELNAFLAEAGEKPYRAAQLFDWLHVRGIRSLDEATNLPLALRKKLAAEGTLTTLLTERVERSALDNTAKYLFRLEDAHLIESVAMYYRFGLSVCVSSQAGCAMGCIFCASALDGCARSLSAAEMLDQVYSIAHHEGEKVARVVVMGSGEPFQNYEQLLRFIRLLTDEKGRHLGMRHITVSTCGVAERIRSFAKDCPQAGLAVSLHAPSQEIRMRIMPRAAALCPYEELLRTCADYTAWTKRRITFEYALIDGINDAPKDALLLASQLKGMLCQVNLIPLNPVEEIGLSGTKQTRVREFQKNLEKMGINVTIRREMGRDINGACGQLRRYILHKGESAC